METDKDTQTNHSKKNPGHRSKPDIFNGPIFSTTIKLVLPVFIGQVLSMVYLFVDTFYISLIDRKSTALISATGLIFPIYFIFFAICVGLWTGISSLVARGIGARNKDVIDKAADSGLLLSIVIAITALLLGLLTGSSLIDYFAGSQLTGETIKYANDYFNYLLPGLSLLLFVYMLVGILSGEGLTKYTGLGLIISNIGNIILAPVFIFLLNMGVKGAGLSTTISIAIVLVYYIVILVKGKSNITIRWNIFNSEINLIKEIVRIGAPTCLMILSANIAIILYNNIVSSISQAAMNSWVLASRLNQILLVPAMSLGGVTTAMIGQNYGRGIFNRVRTIFYTHTLMAIAGCTVMASILVIFARPIFTLFSSVPEVIAGSITQVYFISFTLLAVSAAMVAQSSFQATGRAFPGLFITIIRFMLISVPVCLILMYVFKMEMTGVFISLQAGNMLSSVVAFFWGRSHIFGLKHNEEVIPVKS